MFRPQIQQTWILVSLAVFSILMVYFALANITYEKTKGFKDKIRAVEIMEDALSILKKEVRKGKDDPLLKDIDPNLSGLIFNIPNSPMTTYSGDLESKQTVLKPNFAALFVDLFIHAGLSNGDTIAVGMTGSMPGANIALLSACEAMRIVPIIITSVGASEWGATDSNFTWLDLESVLYNNDIISYKSVAASLGGRGDMYEKYEVEEYTYGGVWGQRLASEAIERNKVKRIVFSKEERLADRKIIYKNNIDSGSLRSYSAYVNIGGGVGSIGLRGFKRFGIKIINPKEVMANSTYKKTFNNGIVSEFANNNVKLINIQDIPNLIKDDSGKQLISFGGEKGVAGEGLLFYSERYTLWTTMLALLLTLGIVIAIGINSFRQINEHTHSYETESTL